MCGYGYSAIVSHVIVRVVNCSVEHRFIYFEVMYYADIEIPVSVFVYVINSLLTLLNNHSVMGWSFGYMSWWPSG